ncbi:MAG: hypothetical protein ACPG5U_06125 [Planktomarina sp.]
MIVLKSTFLKAVGLLLVLAACQPAVPNDYRGAGDAGLEASRRAAAEREAALTGNPIPLNATVTAVPVDASPSNPVPNSVTVQPLDDMTSAATTPNSPEISDENSFDAVSGRESIESDAARLATNRQQYSVVQPTDLPTRPGQLPNIVDYALATNNPVGVQLYTRRGINLQNRSIRACARYAASDLAQQDFLANGGPVRDRLNVDPDGDGYACKWNPAPFRAIRNVQ